MIDLHESKKAYHYVTWMTLTTNSLELARCGLMVNHVGWPIRMTTLARKKKKKKRKSDLKS